ELRWRARDAMPGEPGTKVTAGEGGAVLGSDSKRQPRLPWDPNSLSRAVTSCNKRQRAASSRTELYVNTYTHSVQRRRLAQEIPALSCIGVRPWCDLRPGRLGLSVSASVRLRAGVGAIA